MISICPAIGCAHQSITEVVLWQGGGEWCFNQYYKYLASLGRFCCEHTDCKTKYNPCSTNCLCLFVCLFEKHNFVFGFHISFTSYWESKSLSRTRTPIHNLWPSGTTPWHRTGPVLTHVMTEGTKPLPETMLINHQWGLVAISNRKDDQHLCNLKFKQE